ncbi:MAG: hypothetical protein ACKVH0_02840 [Alphaproteobacteria bacterium]
MSYRELIIAVIAVFILTDQAVAAPSDGATAKDPIQALADSQKSVVVMTRPRKGRLPQSAAASALSVKEFSKALGRTFSGDDGAMASHSAPRPLPAQGPLATGFVAAVDGYEGRCAFAIGGLDYSGKGGAEGLDASAALIFCASSPIKLWQHAQPAVVARKLARLPRE